MRRRLPGPKLFRKYLMSYIVVLLLPLIILTTLVYGSFISILENEVTANSVNRLNSIKNTVDSEFMLLKNAAYEMQYTKELKFFDFEQNPYRALDVQKELAKYKSTNNFFDEIILYYRGGSRLYSANSTLGTHMFINYIYAYKNWKEEDFINTMNTINQPSLRPAEPVRRLEQNEEYYITYMHPLPMFKATLLFMIPKKKIRLMVGEKLQNYDDNTIIIDQSGKPIVSFGDMDPDLIQNIKTDFSDDQEYCSKETTVNKREYIVTYMRSRETGWSYVTLLPSSQVLNKVNRVKLSLMYGLLVIFLVGGVTIIYFMYTNYNPIKKLKIYVENMMNVKKGETNEIDTIRNAIDELTDQNQQFIRKISMNKTAIKDLLIVMLLKGQAKNIDEVNAEGGNIGVVFEKAMYQVVIFSSPGLRSLDASKKQLLVNKLEEEITRDLECYGNYNLSPERLVFILGTDKKEQFKEVDYFNMMREIIVLACHDQVMAGIGEYYDETSQIGRSFFEASTVIEYCQTNNYRQIAYFNQMFSEHTKTFDYPHRELEAFRQAIQNGNKELVWNFMTSSINYMKRKDIPEYLVRYLCFDIIHSYIQVMEYIDRNFDFLKTEYPDIISLLQFEKPDELVETVKKVLYDMCHHMNNESRQDEKENIDEMISYIKENYMKWDFSVQSMAEHFGLLAPNLSNYFKKVSGMTISDCINSLKFEKAKQLLSISQIPLKDIVTEIGYTNVSSFIRKFKNEFGITPAEYRKIHQKTPMED